MDLANLPSTEDVCSLVVIQEDPLVYEGVLVQWEGSFGSQVMWVCWGFVGDSWGSKFGLNLSFVSFGCCGPFVLGVVGDTGVVCSSRPVGFDFDSTVAAADSNPLTTTNFIKIIIMIILT